MNNDDLRAIQHFLLDMDGTLYLGDRLIDGAADFVHFLERSGRKYLFFTNNCSVDARYYAEKLGRMGIDAAADRVLTSGEATARHLTSETDYRRVYVVGTASLENELGSAGFEVTDTNPDVVVVGFDTTLTYAKLETACRLLSAGIPYFATNPDKVCPTETGYIPDCGSIVALLDEATGRRPIFVGKPNPEMARMGMQKMGAEPETTAMIGDRLYTDMQMAYDTGLASILVLSGETAREDLEGVARRPDLVFESVRELHGRLVGDVD
jgi:HAD superfamily hydrolase (TIGR01457 family)